eukprot:TRINITY_DN15337_c1_g1_i6.p1 TRINITY_DN15337_c1_g1~~TRINITY_DN15337_c1_g1_i6.p1  ORF type:complete len:200 (-),score=-23.90 TRINITY_DN15337_c1_g1_i6:553-1077(-)
MMMQYSCKTQQYHLRKVQTTEYFLNSLSFIRKTTDYQSILKNSYVFEPLIITNNPCSRNTMNLNVVITTKSLSIKLHYTVKHSSYSNISYKQIYRTCYFVFCTNIYNLQANCRSCILYQKLSYLHYKNSLEFQDIIKRNRQYSITTMGIPCPGQPRIDQTPYNKQLHYLHDQQY